MKKQVENEKIRLMVFESAKELGQKVDEHLLEMYNLDKKENTFILPIKESFFEDGHLKVEISETVRGKDVYFITDIGNYSLTYNMHGFVNHTSPNDLLMQLKDGIGACCCHADKINIIMPLLYAGRQHRRNTRENLTCGQTLMELDNISKVRSFITFDAHDQGVEHAIRNMEFDNFYATDMILDKFIDDLTIDELRKLVFIAPDNGATGRRNVYLNSFSSPYISREAGSFVKQRDFNNLVDGKYPIISHDYSGNHDLKGKTAIIIDDMISSGGSMFDVIDELKKLGIEKTYIIVTYALFTKGIDTFKKYYEAGKINGVYTSNLSYIPKEYLDEPWLHVCDCSKEISQIIYNIHNDLSISDILKDRSESALKLEKKFNDFKMKNIIFLDIDGVLNCQNTFIQNHSQKDFLKQYDVNSIDYMVQSQLMEIDEDKLNLLIELCNSTNASVVVISSWKRLSYYKEVEQALINKGLPIIDVSIDGGANRGEGIINYIKTHNIDNYIVIDDEIFKDYNEEILSRLVKTSFYESGFTEEHKEKSLRLLKDKKW